MLFQVQVGKLGTVETFDKTTLPANSIDYLIEYGLKQSVNDAHASVIRKDYDKDDAGTAKFKADAAELVAKRVAQIRTGQIPNSRAVMDPYAVIAAQTGIPVEVLRAQVAAAQAKTEKPSKKSAAA